MEEVTIDITKYLDSSTTKALHIKHVGFKQSDALGKIDKLN